MAESGRTAVVGAGAIGMLLASALSKAGHSVTVCGSRHACDHLEVCTGTDIAEVLVDHVARPDDLPDVDLLVVAVKSHQTPDIGEWLAAAASRDRPVLVAQNGVEHHDRVARWLPAELVIPALVYVPVERIGTNRIIVHRPDGPEIVLPRSPLASPTARALAGGGLVVETTDDITTAAWLKLLTNLVSGPLTTLTGRHFEVFDDPAIADRARMIWAEGMQVAAAEGARIPPDQPERILAWLRSLPAGSTTSMFQDHAAGRRLEHDAFTGAALRAAARHQLDVPAIRALHHQLDALDEG